MATFTFTNFTGISIPPTGTSGTTSQGLDVFGLTGQITDVSVSLGGLSHTFSDDLDMLLVGPNGTSNLEFWSDAGGSSDPSGNYTISDSAGGHLADSDPNPAGSYTPTDYGADETDANFGSATGGINHAGPDGAATFASAFGGLNGNGAWTLFIADDVGGDIGFLNNWGLTISTNTDVASVSGTSGDDTLAVVSTGPQTGVYSLNSGPAVTFSGVNVFFSDGGAGSDVIIGSSGSDQMTGGAGRDQVYGGGGADVFSVQQAHDAAGEVYDGGAGFDSIQVGSVALGGYTIDLRDDTVTGIESLIFVDPGINQTATARLLASQLGGAGITTVTGVFFGDVADTLAITMGSATNLDLSALAISNFGTPLDQIQFLGDGDAETMTGTAVRDVFSGGGGADNMSGLGGNDTYFVDNAGDVVNESLPGSGGTDTVNSSAISINLSDAVHYLGPIENAVLTGSANLNLVGNGLVNALVGNAGNNQLNGGAGADYMRGGAGNDGYAIDNAGDVVDESIGGSGTDGVFSSTISINLADAVHFRGDIEGMGLVGASNLNAFGNSLGNFISGNSGNNVFNGRLGADTMTGGLGNDVFRFDTALGGGNVDHIADYTVANDQIQIDNAVFTGLANGALAVAAFFTGAAAHDADDRIIYNSATGALFFDSDGTGATAQIQFATLSAGLAMAASEFTVI